MNIFSVFTLLGGLAFFLYGMNIMSAGLEKMAGGKLEQALKKMTSNPWKSLALGAGITIAIQSSSAMTVMLVGLVNSGIMELGQTIGVIMGSNIGTTLTAWVLSLTGIESSNFFVQMLKPEAFSPLVALAGIVLIMLCKDSRKKDIGNVMIGFSVLMFGMQLMSDSVAPLADMPQFSSILTAFKSPLLGVVVGAVFTGIIQSSAASVGILQALSLTGSITYGMAMPIIMGQNIGTCVTALISSIGVNKNAKRVSVVHISFNLLGTLFCLAVFYTLNMFFRFEFVNESISPVGVAFIHSIFNIVCTALLLPFSKYLEKIACIIIKDGASQDKYAFLDERLLNSPSVAISECRSLTSKMANLAKDTLILSMKTVIKYDKKDAEIIMDNEEKVDAYEDNLGTYLVRLSSKELSDHDSKEISTLLHTIGDFERISDHAVNILHAAEEIHSKEIDFSEDAAKELEVIVDAITDILTLSVKAFETGSKTLAMRVEPLEQVIDKLINIAKAHHVERLQNGSCTIQHGFVLSDLLNNYERVSDHCSNIAVCIIQVAGNSFDTHKYLNNIKTHGDISFDELYREYKLKYSL